VVAETTEGLFEAIEDAMITRRFGTAGEKIILEETLEGPEVSVMALTDGRTVLPFPASQDHKRVFDNDEGPNTGGMGAYAPTSFFDDLTRMKVERDIIQNFIRGVQSEGWDFRGIIYFGLMLTKTGPKVLEFNVRLGDPEAEAVLPLIESDIYEVFKAVAEGNLSNVGLQIKPGFACTVVMASGGYPGEFETGLPITGLEEAQKTDRVFVFHAGTKLKDGGVITGGGRVLSVTGLGKTLDAAVVRAYQGVKRISFAKAHFRNDIAGKALKNRRITHRIQRMKNRRVAAMSRG
jgi:phosphoribosylamine---glycine ligase